MCLNRSSSVEQLTIFRLWPEISLAQLWERCIQNVYQPFLFGRTTNYFPSLARNLTCTVMGTLYTDCVSTVPLSRRANYLPSLPRNLTPTVMGMVYTECLSTVPLSKRANYFPSLPQNLTPTVMGMVYTECLSTVPLSRRANYFPFFEILL